MFRKFSPYFFPIFFVIEIATPLDRLLSWIQPQYSHSVKSSQSRFPYLFRLCVNDIGRFLEPSSLLREVEDPIDEENWVVITTGGQLAKVLHGANVRVPASATQICVLTSLCRCTLNKDGQERIFILPETGTDGLN